MKYIHDSLSIFFYFLIPALVIYPLWTNAQQESAIEYLIAAQGDDGCWSSIYTRPEDTTTELMRFGLSLEFSEQTREAALACLQSNPRQDVPFVAKRMLTPVGNSLNDWDLVDSSKDYRGAFGISADFGSDVISTALAIQVMASNGLSTIEERANAASQLVRMRGLSTAWGHAPDTDPGVFYTAQVLTALNALRTDFNISAFRDQAVAWLRNQQNADGGWGESASLPHETGLVLSALLNSGFPLTQVEQDARDYLIATQNSNGSWSDDPYATAQAVLALSIPWDTDADGMTDDFENQYGFDPNNPNDASIDTDGDGISNREEENSGTNPLLADSDGDGVEDGTELTGGSDPNDPNSFNRPPVITSSPPESAVRGQVYEYIVTASDPDQQPLEYRLLSGPGSMTIGSDGSIAWIPSAGDVGVRNVAVEVEDALGARAVQQWRLAIFDVGLDIAVDSVNISSLISDDQTLVTNGPVTVGLSNQGSSDFNGPLSLLAFSDRNGNERYDEGTDLVLGTRELNVSLLALGSTQVVLPVSGVSNFKDDLVWVYADPWHEVPESNEVNNIAHSGERSQFPAGGTFEPVVEWEWNDLSRYGVSDTPTVGPLVDTNDDGAVNELDVPVVLAVTEVTRAGGNHDLVALMGDTGEALFDIPIVFQENTSIASAPAIGDVNDDGVPEILIGNLRNLNVYDNQGNLLWERAHDLSPSGQVAIANIDGHMPSEVLLSGYVYNSTGGLVWFGDGGTSIGLDGGTSSSRIAYDLDNHGFPSLATGQGVMDSSGQASWYWQYFFDSSTNGNHFMRGILDNGGTEITLPTELFITSPHYAVADMDNDGEVEIIAVSSSSNRLVPPFSRNAMVIYDSDGRVSAGPFALNFAFNNDNAATLGMPTIADFNGDGNPEIALTMQETYNSVSFNTPRRLYVKVFDASGNELWSHEMDRVGFYHNFPPPVSAFDFDSDGAFEVVASDSQVLRILDGTDGSVRFEMAAQRTNNTTSAPFYTTIADVDNDGSAELIVPTLSSGGLDTGAPDRSGILVIGDDNGHWSHARRIWNQFNYYVDNINEDTSVPLLASPGIDPHNTFRAQVGLKNLPADAAADISLSLLAARCDNDANQLSVRVGNGGNLHAPRGLDVSFFDSGENFLGAARTTTVLAPGDYQDVYLEGDGISSGRISAVVNPEPVESVVTESNLTQLPHSWARAYGFYANFGIAENRSTYRGIDGNSSSAWRLEANRNSDPQDPFYEVHFPYPVMVDSVTVENTNPNYSFQGTGNVVLSNGSQVPVTFDENGAVTVNFPLQYDVEWVRITAENHGANGPGLAELRVSGMHTPPIHALPEGIGLRENNIVISSLVDACDPSLNRAPRIESAPVINAILGQAYEYQVVASDPDGDALTYSLVQRPSGMTVGSEGLVSWPAPVMGTEWVNLLVSDGRGGQAEQMFELRVNPPSNQAPVFTSEPPQVAAAGARLEYLLTAQDPDGDQVYFELIRAPLGVTLDDLSQQVLWEPELSRQGVHQFEIQADDGRGGTSIQGFSLEVTIMDHPIVIPVDSDSDGFFSDLDCDDTNAQVNPGMQEILNNGIDDDCNAATPDVVSLSDISCVITADPRLSISPSGVPLSIRITNGSDVSISGPIGVELALSRVDNGLPISQSQYSLPGLGAMQTNVSSRRLGLTTDSLGELRVDLAVRDNGNNPLCETSYDLVIEASMLAQLSGSLNLVSEIGEPGADLVFDYEVQSNSLIALSDIDVSLVMIRTIGHVVHDSTSSSISLNPGQSLSSEWITLVPEQNCYLVVLRAEVDGKTVVLDSMNILGGTPLDVLFSDGFEDDCG